MEFIYKYPRTRHIEGSKIQKGDENLKCVNFCDIENYYLVLEEKVDGSNVGISFDNNKNLLLQSRGHYLMGGYRERQFDLFKVWANCHKNELYNILSQKYVMYGEWLYAKHTIFYDNLTNYFMEFDIYDKEKGKFLSTKKRKEILKNYPFITSVRILYEGKVKSLEDIISFLGKSKFKSRNFENSLKKQCDTLNLSFELVKKQTDMSEYMEGIYIKAESENYTIDRFKYVRNSFLNTILNSETHWLNRPLIPNLLADNINIFSSNKDGENI